MPKKIIFAIIDGLGDESIPEFQNLTPLEKAETPTLDFLAEKGVTGVVQPYKREDKEPTSEDSHLALFGYHPAKFSPGRGVLEALGLNIDLTPEDICLRGNFATLDEKGTIVDRRAGRIKDTEDLIKAISNIEIERVKFLAFKGLDHRLVLVMRGKNLSPEITDGDLKQGGIKPLKILPKKDIPSANFTAKILNLYLEKVREILKTHPTNLQREKEGLLPANFILLRGAGKIREVKSFKEKYGLKALCVAGAPLYKGIGRYLGMEVLEFKEIKGLPDDDLNFQVKKGLEYLKDFDFIFLHFKGADNLAEDGKYQEKKDYLERLDEAFKIFLSYNLKEVLLVITGDHSTCSLKKSHCSLPVPILIWGSSHQDGVKKFGESFCKEGSLKTLYQTEVMNIVLHLQTQ